MAPDTVGATVSASINQRKAMNHPSTPMDRRVQRSITGRKWAYTHADAHKGRWVVECLTRLFSHWPGCREGKIVAMPESIVANRRTVNVLLSVAVTLYSHMNV